MNTPRIFEIALICISLFLNSGCDPWAKESEKNKKRFEMLDKVDRTTIPIGSEFLNLYPDATIGYLSFSGSDFPGLSFDTTLCQRYTLNLRIPVFYPKDDAVVQFGEPRFYFKEVRSVTAIDGRIHEVAYGNEQFEFGLNEWKKLKAADGDFSVIGHQLKKDQPVEGFEMIKSQNQELSRKPGP